MNKKRSWLVMLLFIAQASLSGLHFGSFMEKASASERISEMMQTLTPKGWEIYDRVKRFTPENLYEQINGRAEFFVAYDMIEMTFVSFINKSHEEQFIDLSVYNMGTALNAFGVFSAERSPGEKPVELGRAASHSDANYYVWKGQYYIRVIPSHVSEPLRQTSFELARNLTDFVTESDASVWGFHIMPKEDLIQGSLTYFRVDALGLDFMTNIFIGKYRKGEILIKAFLSRQETEKSVASMIKKYAGYAGRYGEGFETLHLDGLKLISCDMGSDYDIVFQKGRLMGGVLSVKERELAVKAAIEFWKQLPND